MRRKRREHGGGEGRGGADRTPNVFGGPDVAGSGATQGSALDGSATHSTLESHGAAGRSRALCVDECVCGGVLMSVDG